MRAQKRVVAIHDLSCFGKCSLTIALPVISAAGASVSVIPTAVLSTHTGLPGPVFRDLTCDIPPTVRNWQALGLKFDCVYAGYLGSPAQVEMVLEAIDVLGEDGAMVIVDPVMGDDGHLYSHFSEDFPEHMKRLCRRADVILPNMTEAAFLLGEPYRAGPCDEAYTRRILEGLLNLGPGAAVLTGVYEDENRLGAAYLSRGMKAPERYLTRRVPSRYHGTGDAFASALTGALLNDLALGDAVMLAADYTRDAVRRTRDAQSDPRFGINFEAGLPALIERIACARLSD